MTDMLGTGTIYKLKGRLSGNYYEGLLFEKNVKRITNFPNGTHYAVDVKETNKTEVTEIYSVHTFRNNDVPIGQLKGEKYLVITEASHFGHILMLEDLKE